MPAMDWTSIIAGAGLPSIWVMVLFVLSNLASVFLARGSSKDKVKSSMLSETIKRQKALDERQTNMFDELQEEFNRVRGDMSQIRQELAEERRRFTELSQKYTTLTMENHSLRQNVLNLQAADRVWASSNAELERKNRQLTDELLTAATRLEELR